MTGTRTRHLLAVLVGLHGLAHLASTSDLLSRVGDDRAAGFLAGAWTVANPAVLAPAAVAAALVAFAYLATAAALWTARPGWPGVLRTVTLASMVVVVLSLWASVVGLLIDAALLALASRPHLVGRTQPAGTVSTTVGR